MRGYDSRKDNLECSLQLADTVGDMLAGRVEQIRKRKGLPTEAPKASEFIDNK